MKSYLFLLLPLAICSSFAARAQQYVYAVAADSVVTADANLQREDSLLTIYINHLAEHSQLPYDSIRKIEQDSAHKFIRLLLKRNAVENGYVLDDNTPCPIPDEKVLFILKERVKPVLRKKPK